MIRTNITPILNNVIKFDYYSKNNDSFNGHFNPLNIYLYVEVLNLWECILNEVFLNVPFTSQILEKEIALKVALIYYKLFEKFKIDPDLDDSYFLLMEKLEKLSPGDKTYLLPKYFLDKHLIEKSGDEWEDFKCLIKIRHIIMHYKFNDRETEKIMREIIEHLRKKEIKLASDFHEEKVDYDFFHDISTKECVKYFINLIFRMVRNLNELLKNSDLSSLRNAAGFDVGYDDIK